MGRHEDEIGISVGAGDEPGAWGSASLECDIVMKGGITSGVVYPGAVIALARRYVFKSIGGASAGAIAAAAVAAAEYGRTTGGGFARLAQVPQEFSATDARGDPFLLGAVPSGGLDSSGCSTPPSGSSASGAARGVEKLLRSFALGPIVAAAVAVGGRAARGPRCRALVVRGRDPRGRALGSASAVLVRDPVARSTRSPPTTLGLLPAWPGAQPARRRR